MPFLLALVNRNLSLWTCLGIGAAITYKERVLIGATTAHTEGAVNDATLRPPFSSTSPPAR